MKNIIVLVTFIVIANLGCFAQAFTITDATFQNVSTTTMQQLKLELLGAKIEMTFFTSSVRLEITNNDNKYSKLVLDKTSTTNVYSYKDGNLTYTLSLTSTLKSSGGNLIPYITSAKFRVSASGIPYDVIQSYFLKRD